MFHRTIRFRLTFWYTLGLAVVLMVSGILWHVWVAKGLVSTMDARLLAVAEDIAVFHLGSHDASGAKDPCAGLEHFVRYHNVGEYVQILNASGNYACFSDNLSRFHLPSTDTILEKVKDGEPYFQTVPELGPHPIRMVTFPVFEGDRLTHFVQVGQCTEAMQTTLAQISRIAFIFTPIALLALSFGAWFFAGRVLGPVSDITHSVQRINAENLAERVPVGNSRDEISELAQTFNSMLKRLEDSFRKIKQFSGDASHELRTPLTIIKGETEVGLRWAKKPEEFREILRSNVEEIDRMERIIEDLLTLAKSDANELSLKMKEFSLSDLLQGLFLQAQTLAEGREIQTSFHVNTDQEIRVVGDELRLRQLFLNLIGNALKYTPAGGQVSIDLACDNEQAVISIIDNGIGILPEHLPYIFDRFYRIDEARNRKDGGAGLGLSIAKWVAEAHGGRITVDSTIHEGSIFTLFLPLQHPAEG